MEDTFIGRQIGIGFGIEGSATQGTPVAPQTWQRHLSASFQRRASVLTNDSGIGRIEKTNGSVTDRQWADGSIEGKITLDSFGFLLLNMFGQVTTTDNADTDASVKDHLFTIRQGNAAPALTLVRAEPVVTRRHSLAVLSELQISAESGDWAKFTATFSARSGVDSADVPAYTEEAEFTTRHIGVKLAGNLAGLAAASEIDVRSLNLTLTRPVNPYFPFKSVEPTKMDTGAWEAAGEMVIRYTNLDYENLWFNNTKQALSIAMVNDSETIGAAAHPSLTFSGPQVRLSSFDKNDDLDNVIEQTVGVRFELSTDEGRMIEALVTNTRNGYVAA